jgi:hypothetical protein
MTLAGDVEHIESPEKLSLKARLKLFEKEIEQQGAAPQPKPGTNISRLIILHGVFMNSTKSS